MSSFIDLRTETTYETGLHLAIFNNKYKVAKLLILLGSNATLTDYRGWKPLEMQITPEANELDQIWRKRFRKREMIGTVLNDYKKIDEMVFINYKSGFQYLIRASKDKDQIEECVVYKQIERIKENEINLSRNTLGRPRGLFEFFSVESMMDKSQYFLAIKIS